MLNRLKSTLGAKCINHIFLQIVNIFRLRNEPESYLNDWEKRLESVKYLYVRVLHGLGVCEYEKKNKLMILFRNIKSQ